jgi:glycosyltransferase involved in cell wall biosynthesis
MIIPARNEANRIRACLQAVVGAPGVLQVVVVDDE